jgi:transcriptional regulator with XRE-family HTH domain
VLTAIEGGSVIVLMNNRAQLGDFLRRRREELSPAEVGLPSVGRRRTPGLRRDEVADLAHISAVYYERLEQGRGPLPSATVLAGMADALRLTSDERDHMYMLVGQSPPTAPDRGEHLDPGLEYVMRAMDDDTPASITDDLNNVLAQNQLSLQVLGEFAGLPGRGPNLIWRWFTSQRLRDYLESRDQHEGTNQFYVADLRAAVARRGEDSESVALVKDLREVSQEFALLWDTHNVSALFCTTKTIQATVGQLDLDCAVVTSPLSQQRLLLLRPVSGTPAKERLELLARQGRDARTVTAPSFGIQVLNIPNDGG